tara:strand:- start:777 stop:950 length:174 start_codon:yes stop_codon:yes gene_type:complete
MNQKKKLKKTINVKPQTDKDKIQIDIKKSLEHDKKIRPEKVFEGYKQTKKTKTKTKN